MDGNGSHTLAELGEFGFIGRIRERFPTPEGVTGIGDDFWPRFEIPKEFLASEEYQEIKAIMKAEYDAEYPTFYEKQLKKYCEKNEKDAESLTDEDRAAIKKATDNGTTTQHRPMKAETPSAFPPSHPTKTA